MKIFGVRLVSLAFYGGMNEPIFFIADGLHDFERSNFLLCSYLSIFTHNRYLQDADDLIFVEGGFKLTKSNVFKELVMNLRASTRVYRKKM